MRLRMKNFNIFAVHWKIQISGGGFTKNQYRGRGCLKRGAFAVCRFKRGLGKKEEVGVFEGGGGGGGFIRYPSAHRMVAKYICNTLTLSLHLVFPSSVSPIYSSLDWSQITTYMRLKLLHVKRFFNLKLSWTLLKV